MIASDPGSNPPGLENNKLWVIRKQMRRKRPGQDDEVTPLSSYFVVGDHIYMAPTIGSIIESRLVFQTSPNPSSPCTNPFKLSTVNSLTKLFATASPLPIFNPSLGHTYVPPAPKSLATPSLQTTQASITSTPLPEGLSQASSLPSKGQHSQSSTTTKTSSQSNPTFRRSNNILAESLALSQRYRYEYMDENPLQGEPGAFVIQKSHQQLGAKGPANVVKGRENAGTAIGTPVSTGTPSQQPPPIKTDLPPLETKRLKASEKSPLTPGGTKKRKKSKVIGTTTTPK